MFTNERNISYLVSISIHILLALIFFFVKLQEYSAKDDYLLIGFGSGSNSGSGSPSETNLTEENNIKTPAEEKKEEKKVELPKAKQEDINNTITKTDKKKQVEESSNSKVKPLVESNSKTKGEGTSQGEGGFGFELDFGGKGMRRIYSYSLPEYPDGVSKEIDVKLRFAIQPDGTVAKIFPMIKADARLEAAAINSLRQWRFEPLPRSANQSEQVVVITFPYRLQ